MPNTHLIECWPPIAELGIEGTRERAPMTPFPAPNHLHVWWARWPLAASRAAILALLFPTSANREKFLHVLGSQGDPVATRRKTDAARRRGERFEGQAYSYPRAFSCVLDETDNEWLTATLGASLKNFAVVEAERQKIAGRQTARACAATSTWCARCTRAVSSLGAAPIA